MKIKIVKNVNEPIASQYTKIDFKSMNQVELATCMELDIGDSLDYVTDRYKELENMTNKIRYGGTIIIMGTDILSISQDLMVGQLTPREGSDLLYNGKITCTTLRGIVEALKEKGFKILRQDIAQYKYLIVGERLKP